MLPEDTNGMFRQIKLQTTFSKFTRYTAATSDSDSIISNGHHTKIFDIDIGPIKKIRIYRTNDTYWRTSLNR